MGARGEREILLPDGEDVSILFTNQALADAEQSIGKGAIAILQGMVNNESGILEVGHLLRAGVNAASRANHNKKTISLKQAYDIMDNVGYRIVMVSVMEAMTEVITYDGDSEIDDTDPN